MAKRTTSKTVDVQYLRDLLEVQRILDKQHRRYMEILERVEAIHHGYVLLKSWSADYHDKDLKETVDSIYKECDKVTAPDDWDLEKAMGSVEHKIDEILGNKIPWWVE